MLPQHYEQFDLKLAWEVKPVEDFTVIDGVVKNIRYYEMGELEIWVLTLDAEGKEVHRAADFKYRLMENEIVQFTLGIPFCNLRKQASLHVPLYRQRRWW